MQEIYNNIYMEKFPLTGNPLREINIYAVKTPERSLIVDTGFNNAELKRYMKKFIQDLDLDLSKTVLFLTHCHSDHVGLANFLDQQGIGEIIISKVDGALVEDGRTRFGEVWQHLIRDAHKQGMEPDKLAIEEHPGYANRPTDIFPYTPAKAGDRLDLGEFHFEMLDEAGHTPGMLGLYEPEKKILFCGDHILGKITPNITYWGEKYGDALGTYLKNIEKLKSLEIKYLFSSHRFLVEDINGRIEELKVHHQKRLNETLSILKKYGKATTRDVTKNLHWDIRAKDWNDFPNAQKWFAAGEASAHLIYLINQGKVREEIQENGIALYSLIEENID